MDDPRALVKKLAADATAAGKPLDWFEQLYAKAEAEGVSIPWADCAPNPNLLSLYGKVRHLPFGVRALSIGCGLGDDAEWLAEQGFKVTAFDISPTAIKRCNRRFPDSPVRYLKMDLFETPAEWDQAFDLVQEAYTLQALPPDLRAAAIVKVASLVAPGGYLLLVARSRDEADPPGELPWPLTRREVESFLEYGLRGVYLKDSYDREVPPVRRFRACFERPMQR